MAQVKFFIFKNHTKNVNVSLGQAGMASFLNHECFVEAHKRNAKVLEVLKDYVENDPMMGVYVDPENLSIEIDPVELSQLQQAKELQIFLAERNRRIDGGNYDPRFKPTGSDASALTKGASAPAPRFVGVDTGKVNTPPVVPVSEQAQLDTERKNALQQSIAEKLAQKQKDDAAAAEAAANQNK